MQISEDVNGPFAEYGHMVQTKKNEEITSFKKPISFLFMVPLRRFSKFLDLF